MMMSDNIAFSSFVSATKKQEVRCVQKKLSEESIMISATPEVIWRFLTQQDAIPLWNKDTQFVRFDASRLGNQPATQVEEQNISRSVYLQDGSVQHQILIDWHPCDILGFKSTEERELNDLHVKLHIEQFNLLTHPFETEVRWLNYLEFEDEVDNTLWINRFLRKYRHHLIFLKWYAENINANTHLPV